MQRATARWMLAAARPLPPALHNGPARPVKSFEPCSRRGLALARRRGRQASAHSSAPTHPSHNHYSLASCRQGNQGRLLTSVCCFIGNDGAELRSAGITAALGQVRVSHQIGDPQVFQMVSAVVADQLEGGLIMEVAPLPPHLLVILGERLSGLLAALAALLAASGPLLRVGELLLRLPIMTGIRYRLPLPRD